MMSFTERVEDFAEDVLKSMPDLPDLFEILWCARASSSQVRPVNHGNQKGSQILNYCKSITGIRAYQLTGIHESQNMESN